MSTCICMIKRNSQYLFVRYEFFIIRCSFLIVLFIVTSCEPVLAMTAWKRGLHSCNLNQSTIGDWCRLLYFTLELWVTPCRRLYSWSGEPSVTKETEELGSWIKLKKCNKYMQLSREAIFVAYVRGRGRSQCDTGFPVYKKIVKSLFYYPWFS